MYVAQFCGSFLLLCSREPGRQLFKAAIFTLPRKTEAAAEKHRGGVFVPCAVFMIAHQGEAPAGKLHPDLMASAGMQADMHQGIFSRFLAGKFQPCLFDTAALPVHYKDLVAAAVLEKKVCPIAFFRGLTMDQRHIFLDHFSVLDQTGKFCGSLLCPGINHDTAYIHIQPMDREDLAAQRFL